MKAPAGAVVKIYVDLRAHVAPDDVIETESGRKYLVLTVRRQARGKHRGRQHLSCVVLGEERYQRKAGALIHKIRWYKRQRRRVA